MGQLFRCFIRVLFPDLSDCSLDSLLRVNCLLVILVRMARPEKALQTVFLPPGNNVNVQVRNALADAIVNSDERALSFQAQLDRLGQKLRILKKRFQQLFRQVRQSFVVLPGN